MACPKCKYPLGDAVCRKGDGVCRGRCCNHSCKYIVCATRYFGSSVIADLMKSYEIVTKGVTVGNVHPDSQASINRAGTAFFQYLENTVVVRAEWPDCATVEDWSARTATTEGATEIAEVQRYIRDVIHLRGLTAARVMLFCNDLVTPMVLFSFPGGDARDNNHNEPVRPNIRVDVGDTLQHECVGIAPDEARLFIALLALSSNIPPRRVEAMGDEMEKCHID